MLDLVYHLTVDYRTKGLDGELRREVMPCCYQSHVTCVTWPETPIEAFLVMQDASVHTKLEQL
jgi:hypothetical protein